MIRVVGGQPGAEVLASVERLATYLAHEIRRIVHSKTIIQRKVFC